MSDSPPNDMIGTESAAPGGWHQPSTPGTWREPERREERPGQRIPTLPTDLDEEPEQAGNWHLPDAKDTIFTPEDEVEIKRPEDELLEGVSGPSRAQPVEEPEAPVAPEDLMYLIEHIDEEEDDFDSMQMSELVALASLAESEPSPDVVRGADSPIPVALTLPSEDEEIEEEEPEVDRLSPAERLMLQSGQQAEAETAEFEEFGETTLDPAEYARRQLEQLGLDEEQAEEVTADMSPEEAEAAVTDPAEYARQQLQKLGMGGEEAEERLPAPAPAEQLTAREQQLARKFIETQEKVRSLRNMLHQGQITQEDFLAQLRDLMILDDDQDWWMMGVETDTWYKSENNTWVPATPPVLLKYQRVQQAEGESRQTVDESLPWLPEEEAPPVEVEEYSAPTQDIPLDEDYMPLPRRVPIEDPDATVPNPRVWDQDSVVTPDAETVPSAAYSDQTVMAQPVDYGTIEAPFDEAEPPDYDIERPAPIYDAAMKKQQQSLTRVVALVAIAGTVLTLLAAAGFIVAALLWYNGIVDDWEPQIAALAAYEPEFQTVTVLDTNGNEIARLTREGDDRRPVPLEEVSPFMVHAVISLENERFYQDPGWDLFSILGAFWNNLVAGEVQSGGSTITQQVARNLILRSAETTADRKLNEIVVAGELTRRYSKSRILELYLNDVVFFGNQTYGVEAAAQFYFNKRANDLTLPEAAMLAGIIQSPATTEPVNNRQTALEQIRPTMERMAEVGCLRFQHDPYNGEPFCVDRPLINSGEVALDLAYVEARDYDPREFAVAYPHFITLVQAQLENIYGPNEIYRRGFTVTTTLDSNLQERAQSALRNRVNALSTNGVNTGAAMVMDPRDGAILAMVGSPDFNNEEIDGQVNGALTWQQPGSAIKPIVYTAALQGVDRNGNGQLEVEEYYTPATILWDVQSDFAGYRPVNFDRQFRGPVAVRRALQNSLNVPAVKTYQFIGNDRFRETAQSMGLEFLESAEFNLTTGLGSTDVRLWDMMEAFATLANDGVHLPPYTIVNVVDTDGNPVGVPEREPPVQVVSEQISYLMQNILSDDQSRAQQFGLNSALTIQGLPTQDAVAAKTGTSDNGRDLWTMGFTSNRVVGVWIGTFDNRPTLNLTGFTAAAPLWNEVMRASLEGNNPRVFSPPGNGTVINQQICADTGALPGPACPNIRNELFDINHPPPGPEQDFIEALQINSWTGLIANEFCPDNVIQQTFADLNDPFAINWINNTSQGQAYAQRLGLQLPVTEAPEQACDQNTPIPVARISSPSGGQTVQGEITVTGQVSAENFNRYQLEFAPAGTENFQTIGSFSTTQQPQAGSVLGTWDTRTVPSGQYTIRLAVFANDGGFLYRTVDVTVNNPTPTPTPVPTQPPAAPVVPTEPLPFDPLSPTPTVNPLGG